MILFVQNLKINKESCIDINILFIKKINVNVKLSMSIRKIQKNVIMFELELKKFVSILLSQINKIIKIFLEINSGLNFMS